MTKEELKHIIYRWFKALFGLCGAGACLYSAMNYIEWVKNDD